MDLDQADDLTERTCRIECDAAPDCQPTRTPFVTTKEHRRFVEFCDAVRRHRYLGLCYGPPGVGKTLSARQYAHWDTIGHWLDHDRHWHNRNPPAELLDHRTVLYTPGVTTTPRTLDADIHALVRLISNAVEGQLHPHRGVLATRQFAELLVVDEADRLKTIGLDIVRDHHDRSRIGVILIGMPGLEKRLARYPQLYSRVGFVHEFRPLGADELAFVVTRHWPGLCLDAPGDFTAQEAVATIARITGGNLRLTERLMAQVERILEINELRTVTKEVVEAAREALVLGVL
jgi:DNA transposition AAA+ family ATPase